MDGSRFDRLTRQLATGQSRRSVLKGLLGFSGSALVGSALTDETDARRSSSGGTTHHRRTSFGLCCRQLRVRRRVLLSRSIVLQ